MTDGFVRSSAAALVKLRRCTTLTNVLSLLRSLSAAVRGIALSFGADPRDSDFRFRASRAQAAEHEPAVVSTDSEQQLFQDPGYQDDLLGPTMIPDVRT